MNQNQKILESPTGILVVTLISTIAFASIGYTLPKLPFIESTGTSIVSYGLIPISVWAFCMYRIFFQKVGGSKTRFAHLATSYSTPRRIWLAIVLVGTAICMSYAIGYVSAKVMYWPHNLIAKDSVQKKFLIAINPYDSGAFREYAELALENHDNKLKTIWPKSQLHPFVSRASPASNFACVTLQQSIFGITIIDITPCPYRN